METKRKTEKPKAISAIESAYLNIETARGDCISARACCVVGDWDDAVMWINNAIAQLESASAKIEAHKKRNGK